LLLMLAGALVAVTCSAWVAAAAAEPPSAPADAAKNETSLNAATNAASQATPAPKPITDEARACFQRGQSAYAAGDLFTALAGFQCAFAAAPSPELHYNLARVYERMGEAEESTRHYRAYLAQTQVTPREKKKIEARLQALQDLRDRQKPPPDASKPSAEAMSAEARSFYERGVKLYRAKQYPAAQAAFFAALQLSNAPELHFNLAVVAERMNHPSEAVDHYRAYLASRTDAKDREEIEERIGMLQSMGR
jgi:tetratricopeptide (TPR) repeat protein